MARKTYMESYVQRTNDKYNAASKAEKRVMIAKDTILRLKKTDSLNIKTGNLININWKTDKNESFKDFINKGEESCNVCAKGALFCSIVGRVNKISVGEAQMNGMNEIGNSIHRKLKEIFSIKQLDMIETAFEGNSYLHIIFEDVEDKCVQFCCNTYEDDELRLISICENIIKNNGTFIP